MLGAGCAHAVGNTTGRKVTSSTYSQTYPLVPLGRSPSIRYGTMNSSKISLGISWSSLDPHSTTLMQAEKHRSFLRNAPLQTSGCGSSLRPTEPKGYTRISWSSLASTVVTHTVRVSPSRTGCNNRSQACTTTRLQALGSFSYTHLTLPTKCRV